MAGKTKGEATRSRVIEETKWLVNRKGFSNTSISDIIRATGVKKGNLYFHFSSKERLGQAILEDAASEFFQLLSDSLQGTHPLEKLSSFFDAVLEKHRRTNFVGGCIFGNTALEMSDSNPGFSSLIRDVFRQWVDRIANLLIEAQQSGELDAEISPRLFAKQIVASIEGGIMMARLSKDEDDLKDCLDSLRALLRM